MNEFEKDWRQNGLMGFILSLKAFVVVACQIKGMEKGNHVKKADQVMYRFG